MPLVQSLRGDNAKIVFLETHSINCIWHTVLLPGIKKDCCCKTEEITTVCFEFSYTPKNSSGEKSSAEDTFYAGAWCGKKLCQFAKIVIPPLVNPMQLGTSQRGHRDDFNGSKEESRHPLNKEAMEIISLIFCLWGGPQPGALQYYYTWLADHPHCPLADDKIDVLHKAIYNSRAIMNSGGLGAALAKKITAAGGQPKQKFTFPEVEAKFAERNKPPCL